MITASTLCLSLVLAAAPSRSELIGPIQLEGTALQMLREQSRRMASLAVAKDWAPFVETMYPGVVKMLGGAQKAREASAEAAAESEKAGTKITAAEVADPRFCVRVAGGGLQCVVRQTTRILHDGERYRIVADLIAFSGDRGSHWTFLTAANHDLATLRKALPELSPDLPVVPQSEPVPDR